MGRPRGSQKSIKNQKNRVRDAFGAHFGFFIDLGNDFGAIGGEFGWILDGFWNGLGEILEALWDDLEGQTMIRATKGKSIDR